MKKAIAILLALVMVLSLAACEGGNTTETTSTVETSDSAPTVESNDSAPSEEKTETHEYYTDTDYPFIEKVDSVLPNASFIKEDSGTMYYSLGTDFEEVKLDIILYTASLDEVGVTVKAQDGGLYSMHYNGKMIGAFGIVHESDEYQLGIQFFKSK